MKYTRKEILQKALPASATLLLAGSPLLNFVFKNIKTDNHTLLKALNECEFGTIDVILLNDSSIDNYDFLALAYYRNIEDAPHAVFWKHADFKPENQRRLKNDLLDLKTYASNNDIFIYNVNKIYRKSWEVLTDIIPRLRKNDFKITEEFYRPISFTYAACYQDYEKNKKQTV